MALSDDPIDFGAMTPKKEEVSNLLVVAALSASHIAYGSVRMEPVFMAIGQAAALAASIAISDNVCVQDVSYPKLKDALVSKGQILEMPNNWDWRADWPGRDSNPNSQPTAEQLEWPNSTTS